MNRRERKKEKKSRLKSYEFVYRHFFEVSKMRFNTFFPACLYI